MGSGDAGNQKEQVKSGYQGSKLMHLDTDIVATMKLSN